MCKVYKSYLEVQLPKRSSQSLVLSRLLSGSLVIIVGEVLHDLVHLAGYLGIGQHLGGEALQVGQRGKLLMLMTEGRNELGGHLPGRNPPRLEGGLLALSLMSLTSEATSSRNEGSHRRE